MMMNELFQDRTFRKILVIFVIAKIIVFGSGYLGYFLVPAETTSRKYVTDSALTNPWAQYDGKVYLDIAKNGYNAEFDGIGNYAFFPLYPLLIKALGFAGYDLAALLVSNIFSLAAIIALYVLVKEEYGEKITRKSVIYITFFPTAYFFSVMYTESLFLFLTVMTFLCARRGNWAAAGAMGFLAALTRLQGILVFLPVLYLYARSVGFNYKKINRNCIFIFLIPAGLLVFMFYIYTLTGNPLAGSGGFAAHGKQFSMPWETFATEINKFAQVTELKGYVYILFNSFIALMFVALSAASFKRMGRDYSLYFTVSALLPLFSGSLEAVSRYGLAIFPAFILVPLLEEKDRKLAMLMKVVLVISVMMMITLTVRHVNMHLDPYGL